MKTKAAVIKPNSSSVFHIFVFFMSDSLRALFVMKSQGETRETKQQIYIYSEFYFFLFFVEKTSKET